MDHTDQMTDPLIHNSDYVRGLLPAEINDRKLEPLYYSREKADMKCK